MNAVRDDIEITLKEVDGKGAYVARVKGVDEPAEMTFSRANPALIIVDHTFVPDSMRGKGVGVAIAAHVIADARARGFKIVPLCPFLSAQFDRHPEWADVLHQR